jgi:hypothetical protein
MADSNDPLIVRGRTFFKKPFFNNVLSTNISLYKYLAQLFFDGDMERVVWASTDFMFRKRQEQLAERKLNDLPKDNLGILDMPFCSFRITQDGIQPGSQRTWWNPALHIEGIWFEELGRRLKITPVTINYEACFVCNHDSDLYWAQQEQIWNNQAESILESFVDATAPDGTVHTLKNIIIYDAEPHANTQFTEREWLEKNKIQTITLDISCQTWLIAEDNHHRYSVTKKVILDFLHGANYFNLIHGEGNVDAQAEQVIWDLFMGDNVGGSVEDVNPQNLKPIPPQSYVSQDSQLAFDF